MRNKRTKDDCYIEGLLALKNAISSPMWRTAKLQDDSEILEMCEALYREDPSTHTVSRAQTQLTLRTLREHPPRGRAVVFENAQSIEGYALLISFWSNELGGDVTVIDEIYVRLKSRGQGLATQLIKSLLTSDAVALELEVTPANSRARAFYETLGFKPIKNARMRAQNTQTLLA